MDSYNKKSKADLKSDVIDVLHVHICSINKAKLANSKVFFCVYVVYLYMGQCPAK